MKRRDFISKSTLSAAGSFLLTGTVANNALAQQNLIKKEAIEPNNTAIQNAVGIKEILNSTDKVRSGIALGGIGAGGAELRKDGIFYNWSVANNNPKSTGEFLIGEDFNRKNSKTRQTTFYPYQADYVLFFMVRYQVEGENPQIKLLQIEDGYKVAGVEMHLYEFPWMQGVEKIEFTGSFPFVTLNYIDKDLPFDIEMTAWSAFVPHDVKNSSLPLLNFDFKITAKTQKPVDVLITANYRSLVGYDVSEKNWESEIIKNPNYTAQVSKAKMLDIKHSSNGQMGMVAFDADASYQAGWGHRHQYHERLLQKNKLKNTDDTANGRNGLDRKLNKFNGDSENYNALAINRLLLPQTTASASFSMVWHFPNLYDESLANITGHYYSNFFNNANDVVTYLAANRSNLYTQTKAFNSTFYDSTAPTFLLDLVNAQLTTFITSSVLGKNMDFGILEGITQHQSWGPVGTIDVNMYGGVMVSALFPELAKSTMRIHKTLQLPSGEIRHSFKKGFAEALIGVAGVTERLDLHPQYVVMVLRDFFLTNDTLYLKEMWPSVKKALDYTLYKRDVNGDQQPDMTGIMCSYDNFPMYGLSAYVQSQWLSALAAAIKAAVFLGDNTFINTYQPIFEKGKKLAEEKLWNGKYYRLYNSDLKTMATKDGAGKPIIKNMEGVDEACLTDQLIGQWAANWSNLGNLFNPQNVKIALKSIVELSYKPNFGLKNCCWPGYDFYKPVSADTWVDQGNTVWSGVELSFVSFLLYQGFYNEALNVANTVHQRYLKAGRYWDHQEFGGHYFRAMGVWGIVNGLLGLTINQNNYTFAPAVKEKYYKLFFAFAGGYANLESSANGYKVNVLNGNWTPKSVAITLSPAKSYKATFGLQTIAVGLPYKNQFLFDFKKQITVKAGEFILIN